MTDDSQSRCPAIRPAARALALALALAACGGDVERARTAALAAHKTAETQPSPENVQASERETARYCRLVQRRVERVESWEEFMDELRIACAEPLRCDRIPMCSDVRMHGGESEEEHADHE